MPRLPNALGKGAETQQDNRGWDR